MIVGTKGINMGDGKGDYVATSIRETILRKLFIESRPYSDDLKRLLVINTKDCLDDRTNPI